MKINVDSGLPSLLAGGAAARFKSASMRMTISALDRLGLFHLLSPQWQGVGVILTLHHVSPEPPAAFSPNRILTVSPGFLGSVIRLARDMGNEIVSLTEACRRLRAGEFDKRFVAITLDDGYRDNLTEALPVFEAEEAPFTIYVATSMPDGTARLWWDLLEQLIAERDSAELPTPAGWKTFELDTVSRKYAAFYTVYGYLRSRQWQEQGPILDELFARYLIDPAVLTRQQALSWSELSILAEHPLCDIGVHTVNHPPLSRLEPSELHQEVLDSRLRLTEQLDVDLSHFAYPFGDPDSAGKREFELLEEMDFASSVTTRKGVLFPEHAEHMQALPRVSLNGDYQSLRYASLFLEGKPFVISNRFRRLNVN